MLVKRSRKNQVAIPQAILKQAGLGPNDQYFDVRYATGRIIFTPMELEEKIPPEALARFETKVLKGQPGDRAYHSMDALIADLHRHRRKPRRS